MSEVVLNAIRRENIGKKYAKQLRREGKIPGIFYAHKEKNIPLMFNVKEVQLLIGTEVGLFDLKIGKKKNIKSIIKEIQFDPVSHRPVHLDLMGVKLKEKITIAVPIHPIGEALGIKEEGGILTQALYELEVSCLPLDLPERIDVDVTSLKVGEMIHVSEIKLDKVEILNDPEVLVFSVIIPRAVKEEEVKPAEEIEPEEEEADQVTKEAEKES